MRTSLLLLLLAAPAWPDEIQTKDGKKIEFKNLSDEGDYWEITTPQGTKVTVKKADFERLIPGGMKDSPLTGASITFDKKRKLEQVDLLSKIDIKRDTVTDGWKRLGGVLVGTPDGRQDSKIEIPYTPSEEYDVTFVTERKEGSGGIYVGLIGGGRQFTMELDGIPTSGIHIGGPEAAKVALPGKILENKKPRVITCMVRKDALVVRLDGKDWIAWKADWTQLAEVPVSAAVRAKNYLFLGTGGVGGCTFNVTQLTLSSPKSN